MNTIELNKLWDESKTLRKRLARTTALQPQDRILLEAARKIADRLETAIDFEQFSGGGERDTFIGFDKMARLIGMLLDQMDMPKSDGSPSQYELAKDYARTVRIAAAKEVERQS